MNRVQFNRDVHAIQQSLLDKALDHTQISFDDNATNVSLDTQAFDTYITYCDFLEEQKHIVLNVSNNAQRKYMDRMLNVQKFIVGNRYQKPALKNDYYHLEKSFYTFRVLHKAVNVSPLTHMSYTHYTDAKDCIFYQSHRKSELEISPEALLIMQQETQDILLQSKNVKKMVNRYDPEAAFYYERQVENIERNLTMGNERSLDLDREGLQKACLINGYACFMIEHMMDKSIPMKSRLFLVNQTSQAAKGWVDSLVPKLDMGSQG